MSLMDWMKGWFGGPDRLSVDVSVADLTTKIYYKQLVIQSCVNLIANVVSRCEFQTFVNGKPIKGDNYYMFNVEPNQNRSASKFWRETVSKMVYENECLVIPQNGAMFLVEDYVVEEKAFKENVYRDIKMVGNYQLKTTMKESEVFRFQLHNESMRRIVEGLYQDYSELIGIAKTSYAAQNSLRAIIEIPTNYPQTDQAQAELKTLLETRLKKFLSATAGAALPLTNGMKYTEVGGDPTTQGGVGSQGIRTFVDEFIELAAMGFQIPPQLLKGTATDADVSMDRLLTFGANPIVEEIKDEINRKYYDKESVLNGTYLKVDSSRVKAVNIKDIAGSLEILVRIGGYAINDVLTALGLEEIDEEWAKIRWMTKNYAPATQAQKGGN